MNQSVRDIEVIIVDDCSSDGTEDFVSSMKDDRIRYLRREKNMGVHYNYSWGLSESRGRYVVFHDDDDYYTDYEFFRKAVDIFAEHGNETPPLVCVCSNVLQMTAETGESEPTYIGRPGHVKGLDFMMEFCKPDSMKKYRKPSSLFPTMFRADILRQDGLGGMFMDDSETYWHAMLHGDAWFLPDVTGVYRIHQESYTLGHKITPESEERRYRVVAERVKQAHMIYGKMRVITGEKTARKWYAHVTADLFVFYRLQGKGWADSFRIYRIILDGSDFMPELKYIVPLIWLSGVPRRVLRKAGVLKKLYRRIKYGEKF